MIKRLLFKWFGLYAEDEVVKMEIDLRDKLDRAYHALEAERAITAQRIAALAGAEIADLHDRIKALAPEKLIEVYARGIGRLELLATRSSGGVTFVTVRLP
jgi:hypothetical protein